MHRFRSMFQQLIDAINPISLTSQQLQLIESPPATHSSTSLATNTATATPLMRPGQFRTTITQLGDALHSKTSAMFYAIICPHGGEEFASATRPAYAMPSGSGFGAT